VGFCYVLYCISCSECDFICVSLKCFVVFLVSFPLYVKVAHVVFRCYESVFIFCSCWLRCFVTRSILYLLLCSVLFMMFSSFSFASILIEYVCNLFTRQSTLDILCSYCWQESLGIMMSDCVFPLYCKFWFCIVRSRNLMELCPSFPVVNFILVYSLLNSAKVSSIFVYFDRKL
jgi:hypothetical protein